MFGGWIIMSLEKPREIDSIAVDKATGKIILTILDSWDWADAQLHMEALKAKLDAYFKFLETDEIYEAYPNAKGRSVIIDIVLKNAPPQQYKTFIAKISAIAESGLNVEVVSRHLPLT